jgi:hypothetical protein
MIRLYLWFCRVLFCCTRTMGAVAPGLPCALRPLGGASSMHDPGVSRRGNAEA